MEDIINYFILGPNVYQKFVAELSGYRHGVLEYIGSCLVSLSNGCQKVSIVIVPIFWTLNRLSFSDAISWFNFLFWFHTIAYSARTIGRIFSQDYCEFADFLKNANAGNKNAIDYLKLYDYQIYAAPPDFVASRRSNRWYVTNEILQPFGEPWDKILEWVSSIVIHLGALQILYPGSYSLINYGFEGFFTRRRYKFVVEDGGQRYVLRISDGNTIDAMFFDRRNPKVPNVYNGKKLRNELEKNGSKLVICCEGNCGFYESGVLTSPLVQGFSVLGWNTPGFAESTGMPYPDNVLSAMDAVMQLAIQKLKFEEKDIFLFGWSIGGFPATWAAANYPNLGGLILDATFDDLLPLALTRMPWFLAEILPYVIRTYMDLPIGKQMIKYKGPVLIIRRTYDEMIITNVNGNFKERLESNRSNNLLIILLKDRYPGLLRHKDDESIAYEWLRSTDKNARAVLRNKAFIINEADLLVPRKDGYLNVADDERAQIIYGLCELYLFDFGENHNAPCTEFSLPKQF